MATITLRPDLKTSGGEITELLLDGRYAGTITLVYREGQRLSGSVQLDRESVPGRRKKEAVRAVRQYVQQLMDALDAKECEVIVTCSSYDQILAAEHQVGVIESFEDDLYEVDYETDEDFVSGEGDEWIQLNDVDPDDLDNIMMDESPLADRADDRFELVIVGESRNRVEYHIYGSNQELLAEAMIVISGNDVTGDVTWLYEPTDDEIEQAAGLLVSDFDSDTVDSFVFDMKVDGETIETYQLLHEDFLVEDEEEDEIGEEVQVIDWELADNRYSVALVRDDGDALTYDIYDESADALPIGQATVDIGRRQLSGFIDFRDKESSYDREEIAALIMQELDKEKDYESINWTMLYRNKPIDEILFETETIH